MPMPSKSKSEQRLFGAALGGAQFPAAQQIRESMSLGQMRDFARGPMTGKPERVKTRHDPSKNLGKHLHPRKKGKK